MYYINSLPWLTITKNAHHKLCSPETPKKYLKLYSDHSLWHPYATAPHALRTPFCPPERYCGHIWDGTKRDNSIYIQIKEGEIETQAEKFPRVDCCHEIYSSEHSSATMVYWKLKKVLCVVTIVWTVSLSVEFCGIFNIVFVFQLRKNAIIFIFPLNFPKYTIPYI